MIWVSKLQNHDFSMLALGNPQRGMGARVQAHPNQFQHESHVDHKAFRKHDHIFPMPDFRISNIQDFKFSDWGHFEPAIIDFVKKLIRKMAPSQNWVLGV